MKKLILILTLILTISGTSIFAFERSTLILEPKIDYKTSKDLNINKQKPKKQIQHYTLSWTYRDAWGRELFWGTQTFFLMDGETEEQFQARINEFETMIDDIFDYLDSIS